MPHRTARLGALIVLLFVSAPITIGARPLDEPVGPPPLEVSLYSQAEAEWGRQTGIGAADIDPVMTLTYSNGGQALATDGALSLRGNFALERRFVVSGHAGDALALEGGLDAELAIDPETVLRAGFSVFYEQETGIIPLLGQSVAVSADERDLEASIGLTRRFGDTLVSMDAALGAMREGETEFIGAALAPQRLAPDTDRLFAGVTIERALAPGLSLVARAEGDRLFVARVDGLLFGRLPVDRFRTAAGLRVAPDPRVLAEFELGVDTLFGEVLGDDMIVRPYGYGSLGLTLRDGVVVNLVAQAGTRLQEATDGFADWRWRLDAQGNWQVDPRFSVFASLYGEGGEAVLVPLDLITEVGGEMGMRYAIAPGMTLSATAGLSRLLVPDGLGDATDIRLALAVRAQL